MKITKSQLRKIIREEVQGAVREVLTEQTPNSNQSTSYDNQLHEAPNTQPKRQFAKDSLLNDLLNETAGGPMDHAAVDFKTVMSNAYQEPAMTGINGEPADATQGVMAATMGAITKDYSALMKAIDKKKQIR